MHPAVLLPLMHQPIAPMRRLKDHRPAHCIRMCICICICICICLCIYMALSYVFWPWPMVWPTVWPMVWPTRIMLICRDNNVLFHNRCEFVTEESSTFKNSPNVPQRGRTHLRSVRIHRRSIEPMQECSELIAEMPNTFKSLTNLSKTEPMRANESQ